MVAPLEASIVSLVHGVSELTEMAFCDVHSLETYGGYTASNRGHGEPAKSDRKTDLHVLSGM